jgi:hypothetical protein
MHGSRSKIPSKKSRPYIYDVKFLAVLGAPYIYDSSRLRVNSPPPLSTKLLVTSLRVMRRRIKRFTEVTEVLPRKNKNKNKLGILMLSLFIGSLLI